MTASATARRKGTAAGGPPSWKMSSTAVSFFLTATSGMYETPLLCRVMKCLQAYRFSYDPSSALQMECCRSDQALSEKRLALLLAGVEGSFNFLDCKLTYRLRDQAISEITIRGQVARRHSKHLRMT